MYFSVLIIKKTAFTAQIHHLKMTTVMMDAVNHPDLAVAKLETYTKARKTSIHNFIHMQFNHFLFGYNSYKY